MARVSPLVLLPPLAFAAPLLTDARWFSRASLGKALGRKGFAELLAVLASAGTFRWERRDKRRGGVA